MLRTPAPFIGALGIAGKRMRNPRDMIAKRHFQIVGANGCVMDTMAQVDRLVGVDVPALHTPGGWPSARWAA